MSTCTCTCTCHVHVALSSCTLFLTAPPITWQPITSHSCTPVPFVGLLPGGAKFAKLDGGVADIAPTVLEFMGLPIPPEMTGKSML